MFCHVISIFLLQICENIVFKFILRVLLANSMLFANFAKYPLKTVTLIGGQGFDVVSGSTQIFPSRPALKFAWENTVLHVNRMLWVVREFALDTLHFI